MAPSQSQVVAAVSHHDQVSRARPFKRDTSDAVRVYLSGKLNLSKFEREFVPDGYYVNIVDQLMGETYVDLFPN